jgi:hypothetical protein
MASARSINSRSMTCFLSATPDQRSIIFLPERCGKTKNRLEYPALAKSESETVQWEVDCVMFSRRACPPRFGNHFVCRAAGKPAG